MNNVPRGSGEKCDCMGYVWRRDTNGDVGRLDGGEGERRAGGEEKGEKRREREERPASRLRRIRCGYGGQAEGGPYRRAEVSGRRG
jgi:hypothetical protein